MEQQKQVPPAALDAILLQWKALPSGEQEGRLSAKLPPLLESLSPLMYKLRPTTA